MGEREPEDTILGKVLPLSPDLVRQREAVYTPLVKQATERWGQSAAKADMRFSGVKRLRL